MGDSFNRLDNKSGDREIFKFGLNPDIDSNSVPEDIWPLGGQLDDSTIAAPIFMASDNVADTVAGTGMQRVRVEGIDGKGDFLTSDHDTNGFTPVNIGNYLFINRAFGIQWGSSGFNQGNINFVDSAGTPQTIAQIPVSTLVAGFGFGQTLQAHFCVPADWGTMFIINRWASIGKQQATQTAVNIMTNQHRVLVPNAGFRVSSTIESNAQGNSFIDQQTRLSLAVAPLTIVRLTILEVTTNTTRMSGGFSLAKNSP